LESDTLHLRPGQGSAALLLLLLAVVVRWDLSNLSLLLLLLSQPWG
jgi:hypothetical protein